jgi:hypothetical protein
MAVQLVDPAQLLPVEAGRDARWDRLRLGLLGCWLVLFAGVWLLGEHAVPVSRLDAVVSSGQVSTVRVSRPIPGSWQSADHVQSAHWTEGLHRYVASVRQVTRGDRPTGSSPYPVIRQPLGDRLIHEAPGSLVVRVLPTTDALDPTEMLGRRVPSWVSWARIALYVGGLVLLVNGPEPWRARRWAWFWLMSLFGLQTLGVLAFLALSGPTPLMSPPRPGRRPLRSGWAFVIALLCAGLGGS